MLQPDDQEYCLARAAVARELQDRAADPAVAAIHAEFAIRYDRLAAQPARSNRRILTIA